MGRPPVRASDIQCRAPTKAAGRGAIRHRPRPRRASSARDGDSRSVGGAGPPRYRSATALRLRRGARLKLPGGKVLEDTPPRVLSRWLLPDSVSVRSWIRVATPGAKPPA